jgi:hypothetical protein
MLDLSVCCVLGPASVSVSHCVVCLCYASLLCVYAMSLSAESVYSLLVSPVAHCSVSTPCSRKISVVSLVLCSPDRPFSGRSLIRVPSLREICLNAADHNLPLCHILYSARIISTLDLSLIHAVPSAPSLTKNRSAELDAGCRTLWLTDCWRKPDGVDG